MAINHRIIAALPPSITDGMKRLLAKTVLVADQIGLIEALKIYELIRNLMRLLLIVEHVVGPLPSVLHTSLDLPPLLHITLLNCVFMCLMHGTQSPIS